MAQEMTVAMKTAKDIEKQLVQHENRLAYVQDEVKRLQQMKDAMQAEIDKKSSDYNIYIAQRDADSKKMRADVLVEHEQMEKDKNEFKALLLQHQKDKEAFKDNKMIVDQQNAQFAEKMNNIREFVIAVQRACSLIGL